MHFIQTASTASTASTGNWSQCFESGLCSMYAAAKTPNTQNQCFQAGSMFNSPTTSTPSRSRTSTSTRRRRSCVIYRSANHVCNEQLLGSARVCLTCRPFAIPKWARMIVRVSSSLFSLHVCPELAVFVSMLLVDTCSCRLRVCLGFLLWTPGSLRSDGASQERGSFVMFCVVFATGCSWTCFRSVCFVFCCASVSS